MKKILSIFLLVLLSVSVFAADQIINDAEPSLFDYVIWRGDLTFDQIPFNELDSAILAMFSYLNFDDLDISQPGKSLTLHEAANRFFGAEARYDLPDNSIVIWQHCLYMLELAAKTERFGSIEMHDYSNYIDTKTQTQFGAVTYSLGKNRHYIAFRGTDNTIVGWKEDLNLAVKQEVPAQKKAAAYVASIAAKCSGKLIIGGHSKGGNLALYSAIKADKATRDRIESIWNFDGPGFLNSDITKSMHTIFGSRIHTFVPETSVVGMMLNRSENYIPIANLDKKSNFFDQHNLFSWKIEACRFVPVGQVSSTSNVVHATTQSLLQNFTVDQTTQFINVIFDAADKAGLRTVNDLSSQPLKFASSLANCYSSSDKETQKLCKFIVSSMISSASAANKSQKQKK